jgi:hypothetical protein
VHAVNLEGVDSRCPKAATRHRPRGSTVLVELDTSHCPSILTKSKTSTAMAYLAIDPKLIRRPHNGPYLTSLAGM